MAGTYRTRGIVLRRTKLGETDLIVTLLTDGSTQLRAVAKGARKPSGRLAGVVDLGNEVELMLREGRSLDTIAEGKLACSRAALSAEIERASMAAAVLDVACDLTAEGEHDGRLYALTSTALDAVSQVPTERLGFVGAAFVYKAAAMQGYRPSLDTCVRCGAPIDLDACAQRGERVTFSLEEGGALCRACGDARSGRNVDAFLLTWIRALLGMRFAQIAAMDPVGEEARLGGDLLGFARLWLSHYPGIRPRALDFVLGAVSW